MNPYTSSDYMISDYMISDYMISDYIYFVETDITHIVDAISFLLNFRMLGKQ